MIPNKEFYETLFRIDQEYLVAVALDVVQRIENPSPYVIGADAWLQLAQKQEMDGEDQ